MLGLNEIWKWSTLLHVVAIWTRHVEPWLSIRKNPKFSRFKAKVRTFSSKTSWNYLLGDWLSQFQPHFLFEINWWNCMLYQVQVYTTMTELVEWQIACTLNQVTVPSTVFDNQLSNVTGVIWKSLIQLSI